MRPEYSRHIEPYVQLNVALLSSPFTAAHLGLEPRKLFQPIIGARALLKASRLHGTVHELLNSRFQRGACNLVVSIEIH